MHAPRPSLLRARVRACLPALPACLPSQPLSRLPSAPHPRGTLTISASARCDPRPRRQSWRLAARWRPARSCPPRRARRCRLVGVLSASPASISRRSAPHGVAFTAWTWTRRTDRKERSGQQRRPSPASPGSPPASSKVSFVPRPRRARARAWPSRWPPPPCESVGRPLRYLLHPGRSLDVQFIRRECVVKSKE